METCRPCGCKGCRTCLLCETEFGINKKASLDKSCGTYVYCPLCANLAWPGWDMNAWRTHPYHEGTAIDFEGVYIDLQFIDNREEEKALAAIECLPWELSQSGRRKQNFGPKCNFKKRKLKLGDFHGFPNSLKFLQDKLSRVACLRDFKTIEQCTLEYDAERGASIDPHIDDCWIWGERIVTINLLSDSVLTMTANAKPLGYNLTQVQSYPSVILSSQSYKLKHLNTAPIVRIPMPRKSLLMLFGGARYDWEHQVLREDITAKRICLAYREFTPPYLENGQFHNEGAIILERAKTYF